MKSILALVLATLLLAASGTCLHAQSVITGKVTETMNSGGYTYVCLENKGKKTWVAVPEMKVKKGQTASFLPGAEMRNFESKTMKRTFERIVFSAGPATKEALHGAAPSVNKGKTTPAAQKIKVAKAAEANAYTVADLYKNREGLHHKTVTVKGKVVKVSRGIMQRNWIHIQDGTGDQKKGTHNIVVTSSELAAVGDIVTATGVFFKDKDFGAGYKYDAIIEEGNFKK